MGNFEKNMVKKGKANYAEANLPIKLRESNLFVSNFLAFPFLVCSNYENLDITWKINHLYDLLRKSFVESLFVLYIESYSDF